MSEEKPQDKRGSKPVLVIGSLMAVLVVVLMIPLLLFQSDEKKEATRVERVVVVRQQAEPQVQKSVIMAPAKLPSVGDNDGWSQSIGGYPGQCLEWREEVPGSDTFDTQYYDGDQGKWLPYKGSRQKLRAVRFRSKTAEPRPVTVYRWEPGPKGCGNSP